MISSQGTIRQSDETGSFLIEDGRGQLCSRRRRDVIADSDDVDVRIRPRDAVVALHPSYKHSYAPGVVLNVRSVNMSTHMLFGSIHATKRRAHYAHLPHS